MRNTLIVLMVIGIFLYIPMYGMAATTPRVVSLDINKIEDDAYYNGIRYDVNVSLNVPGNIQYVEEYYTIDGQMNPRYCCSGTYYDGGLTQNVTTNGTFYNASFEMLRPRSHAGKFYQIVKEIVLFDNTRIYERWLDRNQTFNDNTVSGDDTTSEAENIAAHETRERTLSSSPVTFEYTSLDSIYAINATGMGDTNLRIDIFKDAPMVTYLSNGVVYRYINLATDNVNIDNLSFRYKTEISWIQNQSIKTMGLFRWSTDEKRWAGLPTNLIDKDNAYLYFESISNTSISTDNYFAIIGFGPSLPSNKTFVINQVNPTRDDINNSINNTINSSTTKTTNYTNSEITEPHNYSLNNYPVQNHSETAVPPQKEPLIKNISGFEPIIVVIVLLFLRRMKK